MSREIEKLASQFVNELGTPTKTRKMTPMEIREDFFSRLSAMTLKPTAHRKGIMARCCVLMPETFVCHVVAVYGYTGYFEKSQTFVLPRVAIDMYAFGLPEKYSWAWREVYGVEEVEYGDCRTELTCTLEELPQLVVPIFKALDAWDRDTPAPDLPFGLGVFSQYAWSTEATRLYNEKREANNRTSIGGRIAA